jgi:hypothetical protein
MKWVIRICCVVQRSTIKQICTKFNFFSSSFAPHILYHMTTTQQKEKEENEEEEEEEEDAMVS